MGSDYNRSLCVRIGNLRFPVRSDGGILEYVAEDGSYILFQFEDGSCLTRSERDLEPGWIGVDGHLETMGVG
jgi:hypothetical protein